MAYKDYMYWITGDIALSYTDGIYATYVNLKKFASKYPGDNIYQIVRDGKWTLDNLYTYSNQLMKTSTAMVNRTKATSSATPIQRKT